MSKGHLKPACPQLLLETAKLLKQPFPIEMSQSLGCRLLQHMVEKDSYVDPGLQHYFLQNAQTGFPNPHRQLDANRHLGYFPLHLQGVCWNPKFKDVLRNLARRFFSALKKAPEPESSQNQHVHVLFWCYKGCRGSVAFCRLLQMAVCSWGWQTLCCIPVAIII